MLGLLNGMVYPQPATDKVQRPAAAAEESLCLPGKGYTTNGRGSQPSERFCETSPGSCLWPGHLDKDGKEEEWEERKGKGKEESSLLLLSHTSCSSCPIFLRTLTGRTVVVDVHIEMVSGVPQRHWYCLVNGSVQPEGNAGHGLQRDCTVTMCARLKGGVPAVQVRVNGSARCAAGEDAGQRAHIVSGAAAKR